MSATREKHPTKLARVGDAAQATGLTVRAIRYYEELGLLAPAARASGANRRYDADDLERLRLIRRLRDVVGLSLAEVQQYLETEDAARLLRQQFSATLDPADQLAVLERAEPVLRRRVALLEQKLAAVQALVAEERTRLDLNSTLQRERRNQVRCWS